MIQGLPAVRRQAYNFSMIATTIGVRQLAAMDR
jgi:hypothetical protein